MLANAVFLLFLSNTIVVSSADIVSDKVVYRGNENENDGHTVLLGGIFPIHSNEDNECGEFLPSDYQRVEAMVFAIQLINNDSSLLPNVTLAFDIRDSCMVPNHALEQSIDYIQSVQDSCSNETKLGVSGVIGSALSSVTIPIANLLRLFQIPQISYTATADVLSEKVRFDYFFRTIPPDSLQAKAMADIVEFFNWTYVFALYSDDAYGEGGIQRFVQELRQKNSTRHCVAVLIGLSVTANEEEYDAAVREMNMQFVQNASVAILFGHDNAAIGMMNALRRSIESDSNFPLQHLTWIASEAWGEELPSDYHAMAKGLLTLIPKSELVDEFDTYLSSLTRESNRNNPWFSEYLESIYNCSFNSGTCEIGNQTSTNTTNYVQQVSQHSLTMDAVYAFAHAIHNLITDYCPDMDLCRGILVERSSTTSVNGTLIREYLYNNVSFRGKSSNKVSFNRSGDQQGGYFIRNLQTKGDHYELVTVGTWDHINLLTFTQAIEWNQRNETPRSICSEVCRGGTIPKHIPDQECCWTCSDCPSNSVNAGSEECTTCDIGDKPNNDRSECVLIPSTYLMWSSPWAIAILVATFLGIVASLFVIITLLVFYQHGLVKASSRELSAILIIGILLCYILPFSFIIKPSAAICAIRRFGVGFCFSVCFSALFVKTNRLHRIFNRPPNSVKKPQKCISPPSQIFFTLILISIQVAIAVVWLAVEQPKAVVVRGLTTNELRCGESPHIGLSVSLGYNLLLLLLSTFFAFRVRKIPENFNEARFINITLYTICIIWLAFIPTYFATAKLGAVFQTSSLMIAIILSATTTLCCLFLPKILILFKGSNESDNNGTDKKFTRSINNVTFSRVSKHNSDISSFPSQTDMELHSKSSVLAIPAQKTITE